MSATHRHRHVRARKSPLRYRRLFCRHGADRHQSRYALHCLALLLGRLAVLAMLEAHAVELCGEAPQDVLRLVFESVRDRATNAVVDGAEGATRVQLAALRANTTLLVKLEMQQRDARLMKVGNWFESGRPDRFARFGACRTLTPCHGPPSPANCMRSGPPHPQPYNPLA